MEIVYGKYYMYMARNLYLKYKAFPQISNKKLNNAIKIWANS